MAKACLIIVFNHRYDKNLPSLRKIYSPRFSHIYFLVPFYNGNDQDVIPVYESSHFFQSYFAQGYHRFYREDFTHYIFTGDDCILNPAINEHNFLEQTGLAPQTDFLPGFIRLHTITGYPWWHAHKGIDFFTNRKGAEIKKELPSREEAVERFSHHGIEVQPLTSGNIFGTRTPPGKKWWQYWLFKQYHLLYKWRAYKKNGKIELPYPVAGSYSDIFIITKENIFDFCRYCGIMAATGLFVELAVPTALLLASKRIAEEKDLKLKGTPLWSAAEVEEVENKYNKSVASLMSGFPAGQLYYHPVKLSKWNIDL